MGSDHNRRLGLLALGEAQIALVGNSSLAASNVYRRRATGDVIETAITAAEQGLPTALVSRVARDAFGDWLLEHLEKKHLLLDYIRQMPGRNSLVIEGKGRNHEDILPYREGTVAGSLSVEDITHIPWEMVRYVYATGGTQALSTTAHAATTAAFDSARARGCVTVYDPRYTAAQWPPGGQELAKLACDEILERTDILLISAPYATGRLLNQPNAERAARDISLRGVPRVVVRESNRRCVIGDRGEFSTITASGDGQSASPSFGARFNGALIAALREHDALKDAASAALSKEA